MLGHFQNLTQVVTAGFDASSAPAMFMNYDHDQGGLLIIMKNDDLCRIATVLKTKHLSQLQKCQDFATYIFEFEYVVSINPDLNVSRRQLGCEFFLLWSIAEWDTEVAVEIMLVDANLAHEIICVNLDN